MTRRRAMRAARWAFVLLTLACAWWGFRGRWAEVADAVGALGPWRSCGSVLLATAGLALTGVLWRMLLARLGTEVTPREAAAVFFPGQLGKYVPGSVWSIAAQAELGRHHGVPARSAATTSAVFLLVHTASGLLLGGLLVAAGALDVPSPWRPWAWTAAVVGVVALSPPVLRRVSDAMAGPGVRTVYGPAEVVRCLGLMVPVWAAYGVSLLLVVPGTAASPGLVGATAAFALAHAAGVLVVIAPAGVGAREGVLVALLAPVVGLPAAAAAALLARVAHAVADVLVAGAAAAWARLDQAPVPVPERTP